MTRDKPNINGCIPRAITALEKSGIDLSDKEREQTLADLKAFLDEHHKAKNENEENHLMWKAMRGDYE